MRKSVAVVCVALALLLLAGCAAGANGYLYTPNSQGIVAGFWRGLWHGIIAPVTFLISIFNHHVQMYEVHNDGGWYDLGFLLGMSCVFGGGAHGATRATRE